MGSIHPIARRIFEPATCEALGVALETPGSGAD